ncbi:MAG TPA: SpoVR family protein [Bdellovibrionota bacterium]|nr:SpoVR family protein [Bdellovibrionota bacterium]
MIQLIKVREEIEKYARDFGLDFYPVIFEVLEYDEMNQVAAFGGFPTRYPHWSFGMEYEQLSKGYEFGLSKIYEMVINNNPCYSYLLKSNPLVDQKLVMAHVYAHCDFFKNNAYFVHTNRKMIDEMANHGTRIRRYIDRFGFEPVEQFLDVCLSLDNLIDHHSTAIVRPYADPHQPDASDEEEERAVRPVVPRLKSKDYMDTYINPQEFMDFQKKKIEDRRKVQLKFPASPVRDVMLFLIDHAPLTRWQRDILSFIREEAYYFSPQAQTKIMNEGWASYWHSTIMTQKALRGSELIDYADHHSGTLATSPGRLNPYKLGIELFRDIEDRWNKGKFGKEFDDCTSLVGKKNWDRKLGLGRQKIFEVRRVYNDITFLDTFLTEEFCFNQKLFSFDFNPQTGNYEIASREFQQIKKKVLFSLTNLGQPIVYVEDGNFENRGEILLRHKHEGMDLRIDWARDTLKNIQTVWKRPVHLLTVMDGKGKLLGFDGKEFSERNTGTEDAALEA